MAAIASDRVDSERERLTRAINGISETLKGPGLSNVDRLMLNEDRHDLRRRLIELPSTTFSGHD